MQPDVVDPLYLLFEQCILLYLAMFEIIKVISGYNDMYKVRKMYLIFEDAINRCHQKIVKIGRKRVKKILFRILKIPIHIFGRHILMSNSQASGGNVPR